MRKERIILLGILILFSLTLISAQFGYGDSNDFGFGGNEQIVNYSTIETNSSLFWGNYLYSDWDLNSFINWGQATNGTLALNSSLSNYIKWSQAYNGTLAKVDTTNNFGTFNQSFDTNVLFIDSVSNRVGIGTTTPNARLNVVGGNIIFNLTTQSNFRVRNQTIGGLLFVNGTNGKVGIGIVNTQNKLNVVGDINATTSIFSQGKNLSLGYDYALNSTLSGVNSFSIDVTPTNGNFTYTTPIKYTNNIISFKINSTTPSTTFRFEANENTSQNKLDTNRKVHNGNWTIIKNIAIVNDNVTMNIIGSSADELFTIGFTYS